jgi:D-glycero-D-manno-heptose 1,7-bisphosphate phosphatase
VGAAPPPAGKKLSRQDDLQRLGGMTAATRAVFLDRDGTLNTEKEYLSDPSLLELYPGVGPALRRLQDAGFLLIIVTNQSGIGRGYYTEANMHAVNQRLEAMLARDGVRFRKVYFAPEAPEQPSRGRKPSPQFLFDARDEFGLDLGHSYMIGDKLIDLECGWNAGVERSILVRTGYGRKVEAAHPELGNRAWIVDDLTAAAERILTDARGNAAS